MMEETSDSVCYEDDTKKSYVPKDDSQKPQYRLDIATRYYSKFADRLDALSNALMIPWITLLSMFLSCCISREGVKAGLFDIIVRVSCGIVYVPLLLVTSPAGICGILLWLITCLFYRQEKYTYVEISTDFESGLKVQKSGDTYYTFGSANVLLAPEFVCKISNVKNSKLRAHAISKVFANHTGKHLLNLKQEDEQFQILSKVESVHSDVPETDFLCLQEVWERSYALKLVDGLKEEFKYFLYDIGEYSWGVNRCMLGSGLMFASKKPILSTDFKVFTYRTKHARYASQGVLCVKVLLSDSGVYRHVGFISNLHTQAFQGFDPVIPRQITEAYVFIHMFKYKNTEKTDIVDFDVICGDFNADNMSPADGDFQHHVIFKEYCDVCMAEPGKDHDWAIGTELRQQTMNSWEIADPVMFKDALLDDSDRRRFILDADVIVHGHHLRTAVALPDEKGLIHPFRWGGMRRIDRILYSKKVFGSTPVGYCFATALTNLTDHLPVFLTLSNK